ncbi:MAG: adenylate kinase family protein [Candidatus Baldrarchaeia archaeon]
MSSTERKVILISGVPGTGKTTIAKALVKRLDAQYVSIADLVVKYRLYTEYDKERLCYVVDTKKLRHFLKNIITSSSKTLVLDTHVVEGVPADLIDVVIILRTRPDILEKRLIEKGYSRKKVLENVQAEILASCTCEALSIFDKNKIFEIDTSSIDVNSVIENILNIIRGEGSQYRIGKIDWLSLMERDERLMRFLREDVNEGSSE